jgi:hypothetical protein
MSIPLPLPELWRENTSGLSKLDFFVTEGAQIADDDQKQNLEQLMLHSEVKTGYGYGVMAGKHFQVGTDS